MVIVGFLFLFSVAIFHGLNDRHYFFNLGIAKFGTRSGPYRVLASCFVERKKECSQSTNMERFPGYIKLIKENKE